MNQRTVLTRRVAITGCLIGDQVHKLPACKPPDRGDDQRRALTRP